MSDKMWDNAFAVIGVIGAVIAAWMSKKCTIMSKHAFKQASSEK